MASNVQKPVLISVALVAPTLHHLCLHVQLDDTTDQPAT